MSIKSELNALHRALRSKEYQCPGPPPLFVQGTPSEREAQIAAIPLACPLCGQEHDHIAFIEVAPLSDGERVE
ncbi:MAG TPA: hypothetical protein VH592_21105 [Gemmataceae bacterium]|jgi:hypothetical protein